MRFAFKCKICGKNMPKPSKTHIKDDYNRMISEIEKATPFQYYDIVFEEEWGE